MNVTARLALSTTQKTILSTKIEVFKKYRERKTTSKEDISWLKSVEKTLPESPSMEQIFKHMINVKYSQQNLLFDIISDMFNKDYIHISEKFHKFKKKVK
jgi:cytochrome b subunit of formate dehydrogenase